MAGERVRRIAAWTAVALVVAALTGWLATAAHHLGGSSNNASSALPTAGFGGAGASSAPAAPGGEAGRSGGSIGGTFLGDSGVPGIGPKIVKQASISVQITKGSFTDRFQQAVSIAGAFGGFVESSEATVGRFRTGSLVIRVPADRFEATLAKLKGLGSVRAATLSGQDVTAQYIDLQARLVNWKAQEQVLLRLMTKAQSIVDSIRVQQRLQDVQGTIERIEGQLRLIGDQTAMATIAVSISEGNRVVAAPAKRPALAQAWHDAVTGFVNVVAAVVVGFGYLVPLGLLALMSWIGWRGRQRLRRRPSAQAA